MKAKRDGLGDNVLLGRDLRVLLLANLYPPVIGGLERGVAAIAEGLASRGHDVTVMTYTVPNAESEEVLDGVRVLRVRGMVARVAERTYTDPMHPFHPTFPDPYVVARLRHLLEDEVFDVVHTHDWIVHSYFGLPARLKRSLHVHTAHEYGLLCPKKTLEYSRPGRNAGTEPCGGPELVKCIRCAAQEYGAAKALALTVGRHYGARKHGELSRLFAISSSVAATHERIDTAFARVPPIVVPVFVPDGLEKLARSVPRPPWLPAGDYLLFVGALGPHKGLDVLFEAYAMLQAGSSVGSSLPALVCLGTPRSDTPPIPQGVTVVENVPHDQVMSAWHHAVVALVPSVWQEPLGLVAVEAMLAGTPVVATRVGGLVDVVRNRETGLLVEPGDAVGLAAAVAELLSDRELVRSLVESAEKHAQSFTAGTVVARIEGLYTSLLSAGSPGDS